MFLRSPNRLQSRSLLLHRCWKIFCRWQLLLVLISRSVEQPPPPVPLAIHLPCSISPYRLSGFLIQPNHYSPLDASDHPGDFLNPKIGYFKHKKIYLQIAVGEEAQGSIGVSSTDV